MYVTTFYSFKGGVGRTMALVNTAVKLALRGRRVLVVDFDVEAPGLDTFDVLRPREEVPGVIDFVTQYLEDGQAPAADRFLGECPAIGDQGGRLWIMPSGRKETYAEKFSQIDWGVLYERHEGFLLFEDLKEQWKQIVQPDYVLIDSRTGHTDTSGICTRQLPDSVVILFFPNEQNLRGLTEVVRDIRSEANEPRNKRIDLHFVMSNVPDLDDEDRILESKIRAFQDQLGFGREPIVVHRYDSLSLLNQVVFTKDRPRSRLANEYGEMVREIAARNWADRDSALAYIQQADGRMKDESILTREEMLEKIERTHADDGEVLFRLGELREGEGYRQPEWEALVNRAIEVGYHQPDAYLKRARIRADNRDRDGANEDAWRVLQSEQVSPPMVREAIQWMGSCIPKELVESTAVRSLELEEKFWLAGTFNRSPKDLLIAVALWEQILEVPDIPASARDRAEHHLGLSYMGLGRCSEAARRFRRDGQAIADLGIDDAFHYGMAMWGVTGTVEAEIFKRVVELELSDHLWKFTPLSLNQLLCMAITYWAVGDGETALVCVEHAWLASDFPGRTELSCWRYLRVDACTFNSDLEEIQALIEDGGSQMPRFVAATATGSTKPE